MIAAAQNRLSRFDVPPETETKVGYDIVHLADNEWGTPKMVQVADAYFRDHPECQYLLVNEHAGWCLGFRRDLSTFASANDMAVMDDRPRPTGNAENIQRRPGPVRSLK